MIERFMTMNDFSTLLWLDFRFAPLRLCVMRDPVTPSSAVFLSKISTLTTKTCSSCPWVHSGASLLAVHLARRPALPKLALRR